MRDPSSFKPLLSLFGAALISSSCFGQTPDQIAPGFLPGEAPVVVAPVIEAPAQLLQNAASAVVPQGSNLSTARTPSATLQFPSTSAPPLTGLTQPRPIPSAVAAIWMPPATAATQFQSPPPPMPAFNPASQTFIPAPTQSPTLETSQIESGLVAPTESTESTTATTATTATAPTETVESYNSFDLGDFSQQSDVASPTFSQRWANRLGLNSDDSVNTVAGLSYLAFERDYRSDSRLLSTGAGGSLSTGSPDEGNFGGFDFNLARRNAFGKGWEFRYFRFDPGSEVASLVGNPTTNFAGFAPGISAPAAETIGLSGIGIGAVSMASVFNDADIHRVARASNIDNLEVNFLRLGSLGRSNGCGNGATEFILGFRALNFDEAITYSAENIAASASNPASAQYVSDVSNLLLGLQIGARTERQIRGRLSASLGTKFGVFNNRIENQQSARYSFADGSTATPEALFGPDAGSAFNVNGTENGLSLLGEIDLGVAYQLSSRVRARVGYRGIAATNIAEAEGQFRENLFQLSDVRNADNSGELLLGGAYYGLEFAF